MIPVKCTVIFLEGESCAREWLKTCSLLRHLSFSVDLHCSASLLAVTAVFSKANCQMKPETLLARYNQVKLGFSLKLALFGEVFHGQKKQISQLVL